MSKKDRPATIDTGLAPVAPALSPFGALDLGTPEETAVVAAELPTLANPARIGDGKSVGIAFEGNRMILICNVDPAVIAKLQAKAPTVIATGKHKGKYKANVDLAKAGGFAGLQVPGPGGQTLKLSLWLGVSHPAAKGGVAA